MKKYIPIIIVLLILSVISPFNSRAATAEGERDADQLGDIGRELSYRPQDLRDLVPVKHNRKARIHDRERLHARLQQSDLLQELLTSEAEQHEPQQMTNEGIILSE